MKTLQVRKRTGNLLCSAENTAICQLGLEACSVYGRSGAVLQNDKGVHNLSAINFVANNFKIFISLNDAFPDIMQSLCHYTCILILL
jgi:hypothetical protein